MNNGFQSEISVADEDFKPKDLELKTIFLTFSHIYILTMAHQYGPILTFVKSERLIWIVLLHFNYIKISWWQVYIYDGTEMVLGVCLEKLCYSKSYIYVF